MSTSIIYNGVDITNDVHIIACTLTDSNGGKQDYCSVTFANGGKIWNEWQPQNNDVVIAKNGYSSSGEMYVNDIQSQGGTFTLILLSTKTDAKQKKTKIWRKVKLSEVINDVSANTGLKVQKIGFTDYFYNSLSQTDETDINFLNRICDLEGYKVKVYDGCIVVFDEKLLMNEDASGTVKPDDVISYSFDNGDLLKSVTVKFYDVITGDLISYKATNDKINGGSITNVIRVDNQAQAERYAKNILFNNNKMAVCGSLTIKYADEFATGSVILLEDFKGYNGKYYVYESIFDMANDNCILKIIKIEG